MRSCLSVRGLSVVETVSGQSSRSHPSRGSPQRGPRTHAVLSVASSLAPVEGGGESLLQKLPLGTLLHELGSLARLVHLLVCGVDRPSVAKPSSARSRRASSPSRPRARSRDAPTRRDRFIFITSASSRASFVHAPFFVGAIVRRRTEADATADAPRARRARRECAHGRDFVLSRTRPRLESSTHRDHASSSHFHFHPTPGNSTREYDDGASSFHIGRFHARIRDDAASAVAGDASRVRGVARQSRRARDGAR